MLLTGAAGLVGLLLLLAGFICGVYVERLRGIPLWQVEDHWSIGIYTSEIPFVFASPPGLRNPVLTAKEITDRKATFVADPFMVRENSTWYMFFEVLDAQTYNGKIGLAVSQDGTDWAYRGTVLDEPYHLSYPYVFKSENQYYMIPDCHGADAIRLYQATNFPDQWSFVRVLLKGSYVDPSIFQYQDRWWLFAAGEEDYDTLHLFHADDLLGPWVEHPQSPLISHNPHIARPAGRVLVRDGRVIRFAQDDEPTYGSQVRAFEVTELTPTSYQEKESTRRAVIKASGTGWNAHGMHHVDAHPTDDGRWIACVDGNHNRLTFRLKW